MEIPLQQSGNNAKEAQADGENIAKHGVRLGVPVLDEIVP